MSGTDVLVAGHVCLDLIPESARPFRPEPGSLTAVGALAMRVGGCVGNTGLALARLGVGVDALATIGEDALGDIVLADLAAGGLGVCGIRRTPDAATSYSVVLEAPGQDRAFLHHTGANELFAAADLASVRAPVVHLGYPSLLPALIADGGTDLASELAAVRAKGSVVSLDLAVVDRASAAGSADWSSILRAVLAQTDVLSPSWDDLCSAWGVAPEWSRTAVEQFAGLLLGLGAAVVAITSGERGTLLATAGADRLSAAGALLADRADAWADRLLWAVPEPVAQIATTTGAGDASTAGLLAGIVRGRGPEESLALAGTTARAVLTGAR